MILAVVVAFFCCQFPLLILHLLSHYGGSKWFQIAKVVCDFLAALNCCINFLIYCFFGSNFRRIAKYILLNPSLEIYNPAKMQQYQNHIAQKKIKKSHLAKRGNQLIEKNIHQKSIKREELETKELIAKNNEERETVI